MKNERKSVPMVEESEAGIEVQASPEALGGRFSNLVIIHHTPEEFVLDFLVRSEEGTYLISRIWLTPPHFKRLVAAIQKNLAKYEQRFGLIRDPQGEQLHGSG